MTHVYKTPEDTSKAFAEWTTQCIETTLQTQDRFTWVVTGGNSPKQLYDLLAGEPYSSRINWEKMHIFWGDERAVPYDDNRNNAKMTVEHLLSKVPAIREQVHIMDTSLAPDAAAAAYEAILHRYFPAEGPTFDLVLNGMGDDGHCLSLFPHTPVIHEKQAWVKAYYLQPQEMYRITMTAPIVNRAKKVSFLAFGQGKADALYQVLKGAPNVDQYPSQVIQPQSGELHWFVDEAAAEKLS